MLFRVKEVTDLESWCCCSLAGVAALVVSAKLESPKTRQVVLLSRMGFCSMRRAAVHTKPWSLALPRVPFHCSWMAGSA